MRSMKWYFVILCYCVPSLLYSQSSAFLSLQVPHTVSATAMGEQGIASRNVFNALQYNPANIVNARGCEISLTKNPWRILGIDVPLTCFSAVIPFQNVGTFGFSYTNHNYGEIYTYDANTGTMRTMDFYERSLALTYGTKVNDEISMGAQIRYAWCPTFRTSANKYYDQGMLSFGASYTPKKLEERVTIGFSCMNFGPAVEGDPLPATMALGVEADIVSNEFFRITSAGSATKPFDRRNQRTGRAPSSFELLFTDWGDFPEDATIHLGTSVRWNALAFTEHFSMFQEMYFGYFSKGPKSIYESFYTHGVTIGVNIYQVEIAAGYAGRWFNNNEGRYLLFHYPWELYQIDVRVPCFSTSQHPSAPKPRSTFLTIGYTYGEPFGRMKNFPGSDLIFGKYSTSTELRSMFSFAADVYIAHRWALVTTLEYSRMRTIQRFTDLSNPFLLFILPSRAITIRSESVSFGTGFRYHPLEQIEPLYLQAIVGIFWMNPLEDTQPKYMYNCFDKISIGYQFKTLQFVVCPEVGLRTLFMRVGESRLGGYSQLEAGFKVGILL